MTRGESGERFHRRQAMELRGYQIAAFNELRRWLAAGERDLLLESPVGSGKTNIVKAMIAATVVAKRLTVILVPQILLREQWMSAGVWTDGQKSWSLPEAYEISVRDFTAEWLRTATGVAVMTRQAFVKRRAVLEGLGGAALSGVLVVADEGHHCANTTEGGKALERTREHGATTLLVSATPWATAGDVERPTTKAHRLSDAEYVMCFEGDDPARPPGEFLVDIVRVGRPTSKARDTVDDLGSKREGLNSERPHALKICAAMARRWADDSFPRAVLNVPRTFWAPLLLKALARVRKAAGKPAPEVLDLAGDEVDMDDAQARLKADSEAKHIRQVKIDAVISCVRMDEGLDWVPCSHIYNAGIPSVPGLILQRWGRAARAKHKIVGYPRRFADTRTLVFFAPPGRCETGDSGWDEQIKTAWFLAGCVADYRAMRGWLEDRRARGEHGPLPVPPMTHKAAEWTSKLTMHIQASGGEMKPADARAWLDRQGVSPEVREVVVRRMQAAEKAHRDIEDRAALAIGAGGLKLKPEVVEQAKRMIAESPTLLRSAPQAVGMLSFTALDANAIAEHMRQSGVSPWDHIRHDRTALEAFTRERMIVRGNRPSAASGVCDSLDGCTWGSVDLSLRKVGSSLVKALGRKLIPITESIDEIALWYGKTGRLPRYRAADPCEKRLGSAYQTARKSHPELLREKHIPLCVSSLMRSVITRTGAQKYQYSLLAEIIPALARNWRASFYRGHNFKIGADTAKAINAALKLTISRPGASRGFGFTSDRCQVSGIACANYEIEADCWRFTLAGETVPDPRPWADLLASGDHKRIECAERVAFLDWKDSRLRGGTRWTDPRVGKGPKCPPAVRRPWTAGKAGK